MKYLKCIVILLIFLIHISSSNSQSKWNLRAKVSPNSTNYFNFINDGSCELINLKNILLPDFVINALSEKGIKNINNKRHYSYANLIRNKPESIKVENLLRAVSLGTILPCVQLTVLDSGDYTIINGMHRVYVSYLKGFNQVPAILLRKTYHFSQFTESEKYIPPKMRNN